MDDAPHFPVGLRLAQALAACLARQGETLADHPDLAWLDEPAAAARFGPAAPGVAALDRVARSLGLGAVEHAAALLALAADTDPAFAAALACLQGNERDLGPERPTPGLLATLAPGLLGARADGVAAEDGPTEAAQRGAALAELLQGPAAAAGLLQWQGLGPLHRRTLALPPALVGLLAGGLPATLRLGRLLLRPVEAPDWPLPRRWRERLQAAATRLDAPPMVLAARQTCVVLRGASDPDEALAAAQVLAAAAGRRALQLDADDGALATSLLIAQADAEALGPCLLAADALPVWLPSATPGQPLRVPRLAGWRGPWCIVAAADLAVESDGAAPLLEVELPQPDRDDRLALWRALALPPGASAPAEAGRPAAAAVAASRCGLTVLASAARLAAAGQPATPALQSALRSAARGLSAWAQVSDDHVPVDAWVGQRELLRELDLLLVRCAAREDAARGLGPLLDGRTGAGVKALFVGASGTGKTLAAQWLADRLARPLVRVDLGAVVSKYIGETEKNLGALLGRAEQVDAVLLFDEADSLFGARTEVRQANDRYANMQTNYLLQRLETFRGLAVLTSNSRARFDDAFMRRLDATIEFPLPDAAQRQRLWALHLGERPGDPEALQALRHRIAALADLPGGHIRNAALTAALLARLRTADPGAALSIAAGPPELQAADLVEALAIEFAKLGHRLPDGLRSG